MNSSTTDSALVDLLSACEISEQNNQEPTEQEINNFINEFFRCGADRKNNSHREVVQQSIEDDPWNPLFDEHKKKAQIDACFATKKVLLEELRRQQVVMKNDPMRFSRADWAKHRLQMKLLQSRQQ